MGVITHRPKILSAKLSEHMLRNREVLHVILVPEDGHFDLLSWSPSVFPGEFQDSALKYATNASFHTVSSSSLRTTVLFVAVQELLNEQTLILTCFIKWCIPATWRVQYVKFYIWRNKEPHCNLETRDTLQIILEQGWNVLGGWYLSAGYWVQDRSVLSFSNSSVNLRLWPKCFIESSLYFVLHLLAGCFNLIYVFI
jgi:hypothetical protein